MGKIHEKSFTEIMRCYRLQPQSASRVYRLVYLGNGQKADLIKFYNTIFITCTKDYVAKFSPNRTVIIICLLYLRTTYLLNCQNDVIESHELFTELLQDDGEIPLSPVPHLKATPMSPCRKVATKHQVFLKPLRGAKSPSPTKQLRYSFARSPSANLRAINTMVQTAEK